MLENGFVKRVAIVSILLMVFVIVFSSVLSKNKEEVSDNSKVTPTILENANPFNELVLNFVATPVPIVKIEDMVSLETVWDQLDGIKESSVFDQLTEHVIIIKKPEKLNEEAVIQFEELAVDRQVSLIFMNVIDPDLVFQEIYRVIDNEVYQDVIPTPSPSPTPTPTLTSTPTPTLSPSPTPTPTPILTEASEPTNPTGIVDIEEVEEYNTDETKIIWIDPIQSMTTKILNQNEDETYTVVLTLNLNKTYAYEFFEDETYCYICLSRPKDVYSKIVVIDAGHGGLDSGTYSEGYQYLEKNMNLDMALFLEEFMEQEEDIKVYMTRTTDRRLTLNQRVNLANDVQADFFISIHCNSNPSSKVNGIEVLYNDKQNSLNGMNSKRFSIICEEEAVKSMGLKSRGIVPRSHNVHIIGEAKMPVALIEVAFMTNKGDLEVLLQESKRKSLAMGLYRAILRAYEEVELEQ